MNRFGQHVIGLRKFPGTPSPVILHSAARSAMETFVVRFLCSTTAAISPTLPFDKPLYLHYLQACHGRYSKQFPEIS
jgi:hypothetical protein